MEEMRKRLSPLRASLATPGDGDPSLESSSVEVASLEPPSSAVSSSLPRPPPLPGLSSDPYFTFAPEVLTVDSPFPRSAHASGIVLEKTAHALAREVEFGLEQMEASEENRHVVVDSSAFS